MRLSDRIAGWAGIGYRAGAAADVLNEQLWGTLDTTTPSAGISVTLTRAMQCSTVYRCVQLISSVLASLPLNLYERVGDGRRRAIEHRMFPVLHDSPNEWETSYDWRLFQISQLMAAGNYYAEKVPGPRGAATELIPIPYTYVRVDRTRETRQKVYEIDSEFDGRGRTLMRDRMHHVQLMSLDGGLTGASPIQLAREGISLSLAAEMHGARHFGAGARPGGVLTTDKKMDNEVAERIRQRWKAAHGGVGKSGEVAILEQGLRFENVFPFSNEDAQFLETRRFQVGDIARIYGVPLHLLMETEKSTSWGTGLEQNVRGFVTFTLQPLTAMIEKRMTLDLIDDPSRYYVEFEFAGLLRGDIETRWQTYALGIQNGILSPNEARRKENMNPREDGRGDDYWRPANMVADTELADQMAAPEPFGAPPDEEEEEDGDDE